MSLMHTILVRRVGRGVDDEVSMIYFLFNLGLDFPILGFSVLGVPARWNPHDGSRQVSTNTHKIDSVSYRDD